MSHYINAQIEVTDEDIDNIVDAALSACSYWCDFLEYGQEPTEKVSAMSEALTHGGTLKFHIDEPFETNGKQDFVLTVEKLLKGIESYGNFNFEDYDGGVADAVLQESLFGEVVYG